ncbi:hypothetical protein [Methylobacterium nigriterrae]|uniref:hypothetical protein n=1 Tax=Methylobacterium nigriterrae TaxID=3127512 RepID=UPI0030133A8B
MLQVTPTRIEQELAKIAFASIGDIITVQEDGTAFLDFSRADCEMLAAVKRFSCEVVHQPDGDRDAPRQVLKMRVELADKLSALDKLARIHRMIAGSGDAAAIAVDIAEVIRTARSRAGLCTPMPRKTLSRDRSAA